MLETHKNADNDLPHIEERQSHKLAGRGRDESRKRAAAMHLPGMRVPRREGASATRACGLNKKTY